MTLIPLQHPDGEVTSYDTYIDKSTGELVIRRPINNSWEYIRIGYFVKNFTIREGGR